MELSDLSTSAASSSVTKANTAHPIHPHFTSSSTENTTSSGNTKRAYGTFTSTPLSQMFLTMMMRTTTTTTDKTQPPAASSTSSSNAAPLSEEMRTPRPRSAVAPLQEDPLAPPSSRTTKNGHRGGYSDHWSSGPGSRDGAGRTSGVVGGPGYDDPADATGVAFSLPHDDPQHPSGQLPEEGEEPGSGQPRLASSSSSSSSSSCVAFWGAVANLCSATLGAGVLSLPWAMAQAGIWWGSALLLMAAGSTVASIGVIVQVCQTYQLYTYEALVEHLYGPTGRKATEFCIVVFCVGTAVAYVMAVGDILEQAQVLDLLPAMTWRWWHGQHTSPDDRDDDEYDDDDDDNDAAAKRAVGMILVWALVMTPLSLFRKVSSLQFSSALGMASITTLVFAAAIHLFTTPHARPSPHHHSHNNNSTHHTTNHTAYTTAGSSSSSSSSLWWPPHGIMSVLTACPIVLFAFSCQVNVCGIYDELPPSPPPSSSPPPSRTSTEDGPLSNDDAPDSQATAPLLGATPIGDAPSADSSKDRRMMAVTCTAVTVCAVLYGSISAVALADFGPHQMANLLLQYTPQGIMQVAMACMAAAVMTSFPLNIFPARVTMAGLIWPAGSNSTANQDIITYTYSSSSGSINRIQELSGRSDRTPASVKNNKRAKITPHESLTAALLEDQESLDTTAPSSASGVASSPVATDPTTLSSDDDPERDSHRLPLLATNSTTSIHHHLPHDEYSDEELTLGQHVGLTLGLTGFALGCALVVPNISVVFGFLGGSTCSVIGFILPGAMGLRWCRDQQQQSPGSTTPMDKGRIKTMKILSWFLLLGGILAGVLTTGVTIYSSTR